MRFDRDRLPAKKQPQKVRLLVRLLPEIDAALRARITHHGDIKWQITQALSAFNLTAPSQIPSMRSNLEKITRTVWLSSKIVNELKRICATGGWSVNALINGALAAWLKRPPAATPVGPKNGARHRGHL